MRLVLVTDCLVSSSQHATFEARDFQIDTRLGPVSVASGVTVKFTGKDERGLGEHTQFSGLG